MDLKTLHLWKVKHSLTWNEGPRGESRRLDDLVTQVATRSDSIPDAIKLAEMANGRQGKRMEIKEIKKAGFVEVGVDLL